VVIPARADRGAGRADAARPPGAADPRRHRPLAALTTAAGMRELDGAVDPVVVLERRLPTTGLPGGRREGLPPAPSHGGPLICTAPTGVGPPGQLGALWWPRMLHGWRSYTWARPCRC
jgi:hypothetical protein